MMKKEIIQLPFIELIEPAAVF